ncbi:MAG: FtsK/SpoIIIE domain-containing protein [Actinomycetota bacterium]
MTRMLHRFVVLSGPDCGKAFDFAPGRYTLGRSPACGIHIDDPDLEPHHVMLIWDPPHLSLQPLGGASVLEDRRLHLGRSECEIRDRTDAEERRSLDSHHGVAGHDVDLRPQVLHRRPRSAEVELIRPVRTALPDKPTSATPPAWSSVVTGIVTGIVVASLSRQWYFAMFSVVTGVGAIVSWMFRALRTRRRTRRWREDRRIADERFARECEHFAGELARRRRRAHPYLIDIGEHIQSGEPWFWESRSLDVVAIGFGSRAITVVEGAPVLSFHDIPVLIDVTAGQVIGIHGRRAVEAVSALIVRMAAQVGPSDWRLTVFGDGDPCWTPLRDLPHFRLFSDEQSVAEVRSPATKHLVIVTTESSSMVRGSPVMASVDSGIATVVVASRSMKDLPAVCTTVIDADDVETDGIGSETVRGICSAISQWRDPDVGGVEIVKSCEFRDLFSGAGPSFIDLDDSFEEFITRMWDETRGSGPRAKLGFDKNGVVELDLDSDGPHGVIIGTTGSGKSELLRQIVLTMAMNSSPTDLSFVLVDYKGGAAFDACSELPHVVGVITDLDSGMVNRVLLGLEAELKRRESLLRAVRARDIHEYQRLRCVGEDVSSLPRLVVVIDELAALRDDAPDFIRGLSAIAQRGRSLGLHLIVAAQRSAALTADVMANASIRIALRVQSPSDSHDVLGTDRAVEIDRATPGRLIVRRGHEGCWEVQALDVSNVLREMVDTIRRIHELGSGASPHRPWCDPLPALLTRSTPNDSDFVGLCDDVSGQVQIPITFRFDQHHVIVSGTGRTNALRAIVTSLEARRSDIDVVVIECRGSAVERFDCLGIVVDGSNHEQVSRALRLCEERATGWETRATSRRRLLLVVDDADLWRSRAAHDRIASLLWDSFERIVVASTDSAVTCIITAAREQAIPTSIASRVTSTWMGIDRPGNFVLRNREHERNRTVQFFWVPPEGCSPASIHPAVDRALRCLPHQLPRSDGAFAVLADTWDDIAVRRGEHLRFLVIGSRGSGVSTSLRALSLSWRVAHPQGHIVDLDEVDPPATSSNHHDDWITNLFASAANLLVIAHDVHRHSTWAPVITRLLDDPIRSSNVSVIVGTSPSFLRSRPDHWAQQVRRSRTGVLLGRSIDEDVDLLGIHSSPPNVYASAPGRGLWVDGGSVMGIVQFVVDEVE